MSRTLCAGTSSMIQKDEPHLAKYDLMQYKRDLNARFHITLCNSSLKEMFWHICLFLFFSNEILCHSVEKIPQFSLPICWQMKKKKCMLHFWTDWTLQENLQIKKYVCVCVQLKWQVFSTFHITWKKCTRHSGNCVS